MKKINFDLAVKLLFVSAVTVFIILGIISARSYSMHMYSDLRQVSLSGMCVTDTGDSFKLDSEHNITKNRYKSVTFTGKINDNLDETECVFISMNDVWVDIYIDGELVVSNRLYSDSISPGNSVSYLVPEFIDKNSEYKIVVENPYPIFKPNAFYKFFNSLQIGQYDSMYNKLFDSKLGDIMLSLLISFLGILTFSLAGVLMRKSKNQNFCFALVAFFGGIYLLTDSVDNYLPLIIDNGQLCFWIAEGASYMLIISFLLYICSYLTEKPYKNIMGIFMVLILGTAITAVLLQLLKIQDILKSEWLLYLLCTPAMITGLVFLVKENIKKRDLLSRIAVVSFLPMVFFNALDACNFLFDFMQARLATNIGVVLTIIIQLINLIISAKKSYDEQLNYEKAQSELLKSRVTIMISQIQPHFLYNSLTSIAQLCEKDPKRAKTATIDFANYLRGNMNSIKDEHPVPFDTELSHLKTYLSLEKMRFGDDLNIVYDIGVTDFTIPSLTVQPLVENAVKHGVGMKEDGGTVTISTREYDDRYEVVVSDDGVGFDTAKPNPDTSRTHLGIENIKERISTMCSGDVTIESEIGKGTVSTIKIYKDKEEES